MPSEKRDPTANQLNEWRKQNEKNPTRTNTKSLSGNLNPVDSDDTTLTVGLNGPILFYDTNFFEQWAHFVRERIPERIIFAKGAGAYGYFESTTDISHFSKACLFQPGKRTNVMVRLSTDFGIGSGSPDTKRALKGFSIRFQTEEGYWDLLGLHIPVYPVKDPKLQIHLTHATNTNPATGVPDSNAFWDFATLVEETVHSILYMYGPDGIPDGYRHMNAYSINTYSFINESNKVTYVRFTWKSLQGIKSLTSEEAQKKAGKDPDYYIGDLYNAIGKGQFPSWTLYIQTMSPEEVKNLSFDPFNVTQIWPEDEFPLKPIGKLVLDRNPKNWFAEIEQLAFNPANFIPGIGASPDINLQGRLFCYGDAQRYRLGARYFDIPVNSPNRLCNYMRDGQGAINNQGGAPNYRPNSFGGPEVKLSDGTFISAYNDEISGVIGFYSQNITATYGQSRDYLKSLTKTQKDTLIENLANELNPLMEKIRNRALKMFQKVEQEFADKIKEKLNIKKEAKL